MMDVGQYRDRRQAGEVLAAYVQGQLGPVDSLVLGIPRGGVPVALEVARALDAPLDVLAVRKLGAPARPEITVGALGPDGTQVFDANVMAQLGIEMRDFESIADRAWEELSRQQRAYDRDRPHGETSHATVIIVDEGLATGLAMRAAIETVRHRGSARIVVAAPVGDRDTCQNVAAYADMVVCPLQPREFSAVRHFYQDFGPTSDDEVRDCLRAAADHVRSLHGWHRHR